jgi:hypothetical protein
MNQALDAGLVRRRLAESGKTIGDLAVLASTSYGSASSAVHGRRLRLGVALRICGALESLEVIPALAAYLPSQ